MSDKYDYLKIQWKNSNETIDSNEKREIDTCFKRYVEKINSTVENTKLKLEEYTNRKSELKKGCDYFCTFIENRGSNLYGSASAGTATYFGIKKNDDKSSYYISKKVDGTLEKKDATEEEAKEKFNKVLENLIKLVENEVNDTNYHEIFRAVEEENIITSKVMLRKIVAMFNKNKFLYAYSDEAIDTIYNFFIEGTDAKTNIEKNYKVTQKLKDIFTKDNDNEDDEVYFIRLSRFIWSIFGSVISLEAKNMILHGAPGTGKTYSIKNTVKNIILKQGGDIDRQLVFTQFHPSYSYEDFIDGIKPNGIDKKTGQLIFELKNGSFKELCRIAAIKLKEERENKINENELTKFFFVADEINRAELSRVFGELLICLEDDYRIDFDSKGDVLNEENLITLQNANLDMNPVLIKNEKKYFGVPSNLYFIGTMNDIDRSVESFDMALRRRFYWKEIRCNYVFIDSLFNKQEYTKICKKLNRYITGYKEEKRNGKIEKVEKVEGYQSLGLGTSFELGHAYFKDVKFPNDKEINILWNSKIEPLLKEYLRSECSSDEIFNKLIEAKKIFTLPKKENNDTNS